MRTITISELKATGTDTWSVKDNSVGDKVVIDNYFTLVTEN